LKKIGEIKENDAFLILASPEEKIHTIVDQIILRIEHIRDNGIPTDTRLATQSGETKFLRPRPGAARMYPETDIPPIIITKEELSYAQNNIPKSWDDSIKELETKYLINPQLAEQIFDSRYIGLFEKIIEEINTNPTFVASILCSSITNLERSGLDSNLLKNEEILKLFQLLEEGKIAKESIEIIFENIMAGKSKTVEEAMKNASIQSVNEDDLEKIIESIIEKNEEIIKNQKERAIGPLMGIVMKELRGKASGETINSLLSKNLKKKLENL
jgi:glutamyl-tRNA(Gln) amidotransferase subunit E